MEQKVRDYKELEKVISKKKARLSSENIEAKINKVQDEIANLE